jgi:hypothetical protein
MGGSPGSTPTTSAFGDGNGTSSSVVVTDNVELIGNANRPCDVLKHNIALMGS